MDFTFANATLVALLESTIMSFFFPQFVPTCTLTTLLLIFLFFNFSAVIIYNLVVYPFFLSPLRHLPQARGFWPLVGHGLIMFQRPAGEPHLRMMKETENEGMILTRGFFHSDRLIVTNPTALADVLVHKTYDMEKPPWARAFLRKFLGDGLLMTEGDEYETSMDSLHVKHRLTLYTTVQT
jgi:hypothetical protein